MRWSEAKFFLAVFAIAGCGGGAGTFAMLRQQSKSSSPPRLTTVSPEQMTAIVGSGKNTAWTLVEFMDYQLDAG